MDCLTLTAFQGVGSIDPGQPIISLPRPAWLSLNTWIHWREQCSALPVPPSEMLGEAGKAWMCWLDQKDLSLGILLRQPVMTFNNLGENFGTCKALWPGIEAACRVLCAFLGRCFFFGSHCRLSLRAEWNHTAYGAHHSHVYLMNIVSTAHKMPN